MAINYEPVGWDTTKYFNPTNMNHMDDGIKAACDKADANEAAISEVNSNLDEFKDTLGSSESIKIDTSYYTDSISIQFNSSYKIYGLKMAFIYTKLTNSSPYPSNAVWGRVSCPPKSLIDIPAFVKTTADQWIPFYITINTNGEIRQNLTGEAKEIWICGSYIY